MADVLDLNTAERLELYRLADLRIHPTGPLPISNIQRQAQLNLRQALSEIDHDMPTNISGTAIGILGYAAAWSLSRYAAMDIAEYAPDRFAWPESIATEKIITPSVPEDQRHPIPPELIEENMPQLTHSLRIEQQQAFYLGLDMAEVYIRCLFSDLERTREVVGALRRWSIAEQEDSTPTVTLTFRDVDRQSHNIPGIKPDTALLADKRDLAGYLWESANTRGERDELRHYPYRFEDIDRVVLSTYGFARFYIAIKGRIWVSTADLHNVRSSLYVVRSKTWSSAGAFQDTIRRHLSRVHAETLHLYADDLMDDDDLAATSNDEPRSRIIYTLEDALRRMEWEAERGTLIDTFAPTTKAKPKARARRTGTASTKRKPAAKARRKTRKKGR